MVIEYLVTSLALSFGRKLSERWVDEAVEVADQQTRKQLKRLFDDPDDGPARQELVAHLEEHPVEADKLIARALPHFEIDRTHLGRVRHYIWILNWTLERVHSLQRPAALPGFLNTPGCVSIFDTRPPRVALGLDPPKTEIRDRFEDDDKESRDPICWLFPKESHGIAIRLVPIADGAGEGLVSQLNSQYEDLGDRPLIEFPEGARMVDAIAWNRIDLVRPTRKRTLGTIEIDDKEEASTAELDWCKIRGTEGVIAMRDGLLAQLATVSAEYERWAGLLRGFEASGEPGASPRA